MVLIFIFLFCVAENFGKTSLGPCGSYNRDIQCSCLHKGGQAAGISAIFG